MVEPHTPILRDGRFESNWVNNAFRECVQALAHDFGCLACHCKRVQGTWVRVTVWMRPGWMLEHGSYWFV